MLQTWCNFSIRLNQSPPPSIYHVSKLDQSDSINQLFRPLITCQTWCNFSIRINQSPPPSIYHVSKLFATGFNLTQSIISSVRYSRVKPSTWFNPNQSITSSLHLSCVKFCSRCSIWLNQSTLLSVNHTSNLVQFFNPTQSITSSLYLSCVKVGSGPNGSLGRIIYHFFPVRHTPSLSLNQDSPHKIFMWAIFHLFYTYWSSNFSLIYICGS